MVVGAAFVLPKLTGTHAYSRQAIALGGGSLVAALCVAAVHVNQIPAYLQRVTPQAVAKLAATQERAPAGAEFVVSQGIIGRFSMGRSTYPYWAEGSPERFPITGHGGMIVFVLAPVQGTAEGYLWETRQAIRYVETTLHARGLEEGIRNMVVRMETPVGCPRGGPALMAALLSGLRPFTTGGTR